MHIQIHNKGTHTLWDDRRHSPGRTESPGPHSVILDDASVREGGVSITNAVMQSPSSIASQVLMAASHVSFLSQVSLYSPATPTGVVATPETMTPLLLLRIPSHCDSPLHSSVDSPHYFLGSAGSASC
jgi:hypothetical protein